MNKTCCFTGHRPNKVGGYNIPNPTYLKIINSLKKEIDILIKDGYRNFISGMALGIDQWAVEILIEFRKKYPDIKIIAAIPCLNQEKMWITSAQDHYSELLVKCDKIHFVSDKEYTKWCMQKRNEYMVDNSDCIIAVFDGTSGGTKNCVDYANKKNKKIIRISPN